MCASPEARAEEVAVRHTVTEICQTPLSLSLSLFLSLCLSLRLCLPVYIYIYKTLPISEQFVTVIQILQQAEIHLQLSLLS